MANGRRRRTGDRKRHADDHVGQHDDIGRSDGKVYVAHGTITATLVADPSTTATGTVTLTANF